MEHPTLSQAGDRLSVYNRRLVTSQDPLQD
jgi:hypothetical protein